MKIFTQEELNPSESTLRLLKQLAHACNTLKMSDKQTASLYLN
jgi:hypothetical protein